MRHIMFVGRSQGLFSVSNSTKMIAQSLFLLCFFWVAPSLGDIKSLPEQIPSSLIQMGQGPYFPTYAFLVDKKARTIAVWGREGESIRKFAEFPSDMGKKSGDKTARGDHRTPEGIYFLQTMLDSKQIPFDLYGVRAFTTDYPNLFDRLAGKTGDGIWLHAIPDKETLERGSRGCVVVRNDTILELSPYVKLRHTPIIITDQLQFTTPADLETEARELKEILESWRKAWQSKDVESYIAFYGDQFKSLGMNRSQWKEFKSGLNTKYASIDIKLSEPAIYAFRDVRVVRMLQAYRSTTDGSVMKEDFGEKTLFFLKQNNRYRILGEQWGEERGEDALQTLQQRPIVSQTTASSSIGTK